MDTLKLWAVVWTPKAMETYGVKGKEEQVLSVEPKEDIRANISKHKLGRPVMRYTEPLAIFNERNEAEAYRANNGDWVVVPCELEIKLPM